MVSFIIIAKDITKRQEYIQKYCQQLSVDPIDITVIEKETAVKQNVQSIGIDEIKNLHHKLYLKPIKSPVKAVIIEDAQLLTIEAQNSLLKVLEEPPDSTLIFLSTDSEKSLLPTIISRCQIITVGAQNFVPLTSQETKEFTDFLAGIPTMTIGDCLKKAEKLAKDKPSAIIWLEKMIIFTRNQLIESYSPSQLIPTPIWRGQGEVLVESESTRTNFYLHILKTLQQAHKILKTTNTNPRFCLENMFLNLS